MNSNTKRTWSTWSYQWDWNTLIQVLFGLHRTGVFFPKLYMLKQTFNKPWRKGQSMFLCKHEDETIGISWIRATFPTSRRSLQAIPFGPAYLRGQVFIVEWGSLDPFVATACPILKHFIDTMIRLFPESRVPHGTPISALLTSQLVTLQAFLVGSHGHTRVTANSLHKHNADTAHPMERLRKRWE